MLDCHTPPVPSVYGDAAEAWPDGRDAGAESTDKMKVMTETVTPVEAQRAHWGPHAYVGGPLRTREEREAELASVLAPGATRPVGAGRRAVDEDPDPYRLCFERDLDRVKHSRPWRRLAGKCQVFIAPEDDHLRTRLTHAVEVAQVAVGIARAANLCVPLTEAIALAHDCGHGPAGHASEEAFSPYVPGTGYDHAVYGADVTLASLNLCAETLDGVRNHSWRRPAPATPEGEVVSWADRIAYVCHDFEDAVRAGILEPDDLPALVRGVAGSRRSEQIGTFLHAVLDAIERTGQVGMTEPAASALQAFRDFNFERIYLRPAARRQAERVIWLLRGLVDHFADTPRRLPDERGAASTPGSPEAAALAVEYVSGMTDRYALGLGVELLGWRPEDLPRGV
jgi:dGTPase